MKVHSNFARVFEGLLKNLGLHYKNRDQLVQGHEGMISLLY